MNLRSSFPDMVKLNFKMSYAYIQLLVVKQKPHKYIIWFKWYPKAKNGMYLDMFK